MARKSFGGPDFESCTYDDNASYSSSTSPPVGTLRLQDATLYSEILDSTSTTVFTGTLGKGSIRKESIVITAGTVEGTDDGAGNLSGTGVSTGTVNYETGAVSITFSSAVSDTGNVRANFKTTRSVYGGEYEEGTITFPEWTADGLVELFGFEVHEIHAYEDKGPQYRSKLTDIRYQLSVDGGTTWKYWSGSGTWDTVASDDDYNSWETVDEEISNLTFDSSYGSKSITVKAKLYPSSSNIEAYEKKFTPKLQQISILHELQYEFLEDVLRGLKQYCDSNLKIMQHQTSVATSAAQTGFTLAVHEEQDTSSDPSLAFSAPVTGIKAYNLTDDPGRTTELAFSFDSDQTVTLTSGVDSGDKVYLSYETTIPSFIATDERINTSTSRAIILAADSMTTDPVKHGMPEYTEIEPDFSNRQVRKRIPSQVQSVEVVFTAQSPSQREAVQTVSAVQKLLEHTCEVDSPATGQKYEIVNITGLMEDTTVVGSNLYTKSFLVEMRGRIFYPDYTTESTVEEVHVPLSLAQKPYAHFTTHIIDEADVGAANTVMSLVINSPAIEVWDRNGLRTGVYTTIASAVAGLHTNGGRIVLGPGNYDLSALTKVSVTGNNVTIEGCGIDTVLIPSTDSVGLLDVTGTNFTLKNLKVSVTAFTNDQVIVKLAGDDTIVTGCHFELSATGGSTSNPVYLLDLGDGTNAHDRSLIENNTFVPNAGTICFRSRKGNDTKFSDNKLYHDSGSGDKVYKGLVLSEESDFTVSENHFRNLGVAGTSIDSLIEADTCSFGKINDNIFKPINCKYVLNILGCDSVNIDGNVFRNVSTIDTSGHVVFIDEESGGTDSTNIRVSNNIFDGCGASGKYQVNMNRCSNITVGNNQFLNSQSESVSLTNNSSLVSIQCNIHENGNALDDTFVLGATGANWRIFGEVFKGYGNNPPYTAPGAGFFGDDSAGDGISGADYNLTWA